MKQTFKCEYCKKEFTPKDTHKNRLYKFCSRKCSAESYGSRIPESTRAKLRANTQQKWKNPEFRHAILSKAKKFQPGHQRTPEQEERHRQGMRDKWADPEYKNRVGQHISIARSTPSEKKRQSALLTKYWADDRTRTLLLEQNPSRFRSKEEKQMQTILEQLHVPFKKSRLSWIKHSYLCDFLLPEQKIVIEVDGTYWHNYPYGRELDPIRTKEIEAAGYRVLRFWHSSKKPTKYDGKILDFTLEDVAEKLGIPISIFPIEVALNAL